MTASQQRFRRATFSVIAPFALLLLFWFGLLITSGAFSKGPGGSAFREDFDVYFSAARLMHIGANPNDDAVLYRTETRTLGAQGLKVVEPRALVRVASPPLFFWSRFQF